MAVLVLYLAGGEDQKDTTATVDLAHRGRAIAATPGGISLEYDSIEAYAGPPNRRNEAFAGLLRRLAKESGAPVRLRVGGNSTDQSWWNPSGERRPATVLFDITPATLDSLAWLVRRTDARVTLGVNLALDDPERAVAFARAAQRRLPPGSLEALEIGNEPDLYASERTFHVGPLVLRRLRKRERYDPVSYERELHRYLVALSDGLEPVPKLLIGSFAGSSWLPALPGLLDRQGGLAGGITTHVYALRRCEDKTPPQHLTDRLVDPQSTRDLLDDVAPVLALGKKHGLPVRVTELNSAVCGGVPGVSDTFASALWLQGALSTLAAAGVAETDVHSFPGAFYAPIDVRKGDRGAVTTPRPGYGGMLLFARSAPRGSRVAAVRLSGPHRDVQAWATIASDGRARVTLVRTAEAEARTVHVVASPRRRGCATVERLEAPSLGSRAGAQPTRVGRVCPDAAGAYPVRLSGPSAVLLTLPRR